MVNTFTNEDTTQPLPEQAEVTVNTTATHAKKSGCQQTTLVSSAPLYAWLIGAYAMARRRLRV